MTRINTNVSSLVARNTLGRSNAALEQSLTRLSTGLRINTGKDDPAGLIASENLRSDITSIRKAISNTERANQVIATADGALGQVSSLLNDIRGLVTETANTGALSDEQIAANQLQLDSSLEALNRIAQTTTFQGRRLLDGSLDFITEAGTNFGELTNLKIDQANLGATGEVSIDVNVTTAATQAQVNVENIPVAVTAVAASTATPVTIANTEIQSQHQVTFGAAADITLIALNGGGADAAAGNTFSGITIVDGAVPGTSYNATNGVLTVNLDITGGDNTVADLETAIEAGSDFDVTVNAGGAQVVAAGALVFTDNDELVTGRDAGSATIDVAATSTGTAFNNVTVTVQEDTGVGTTPQVEIDVNGNIIVTVDDALTTTLQSISDAIDGLSDFSAELTVASGDGNYLGASASQSAIAVQTLTGGIDGSGGLAEDAVIELTGSDGAEVFNLKSGTSISELVAQINLVKDATGVEASANGTTLELNSTGFGSSAIVDLKVVSELATGTFTTEVESGARAEGTDVVATVNGISATGSGNTLSINTATLDLTAAVEEGFTGTIEFDITGGGALFQLGPDVVSNQQARLGVTSVNTSRLGGVSGKLFQLASGADSDLTTDLNNAAKIVEEAINQVTSLRGRLGAFQRTTLETNKNALNDTLINLTEAESQIRDADFAAESAELTRAQILVQAGTTVLQIANSNPQNVLALLR